MAAFITPVLANDGSDILPVTGTFYTALISNLDANRFDNWQFYIEFFSDAGATIPVTPTAGTIDVAASPMGNNYLTASNVATIQANACSSPNSSYTPPAAEGAMARGRIILSGITGAVTCRAIFRRF